MSPVVAAAEPAHVERLGVIVVMGVGTVPAADLAGLANETAFLNCGLDCGAGFLAL